MPRNCCALAESRQEAERWDRWFLRPPSNTPWRSAIIRSDAGQRRLGGSRDSQVSEEVTVAMPLLPERDCIGNGIAVAHAHGFDRHGVPHDVSQSAHRGERFADLVPVAVQRQIFRQSHAREASRIRRDLAAILNIDSDTPTGWDRFLQRDNRFREGAGMVDVGGVGFTQPLQLALRLGETVAVERDRRRCQCRSIPATTKSGATYSSAGPSNRYVGPDGHR